MQDKTKNWLIILCSLLGLIGFYFLAKSLSPELLKDWGISIPLPIFTFVIGLLDGFNPCTLFILTLLLGLLVSVSHSRKTILLVGFTFAGTVMAIYFLFMLAWLNIFKFIGFATSLRYAIAALAIIAGVINCKELFFFRKGITLMIAEKYKAPLVRKIQSMKDIIMHGSVLTVILASVTLAAFSSLVEIPCTAGFPLIYTSVLAGKGVTGLWHILYLMLYNLLYILPLSIVILIVAFTFKEEHISKHQMQIIKYIGGFVMLLLGILLLVNPGLLV